MNNPLGHTSPGCALPLYLPTYDCAFLKFLVNWSKNR